MFSSEMSIQRRKYADRQNPEAFFDNMVEV
ncbi:hypothetical protein GGR14_002532 [Butyricimonas faecihominis]|uniref:Uncharacterized protein n=1 Tax=Butyricimonas faecihominis TaxID=1472416 RepID=A0A7W6HXC7_9BACT|nr:hypothetical protein [Butyricimonas faecihominis]